MRHLDDTADVGDGLALDDQLLGSFQLADDLLRRVPGAFHGRVPGPVWPDEDSHSPWTDLRFHVTGLLFVRADSEYTFSGGPSQCRH